VAARLADAVAHVLPTPVTHKSRPAVIPAVSTCADATDKAHRTHVTVCGVLVLVCAALCSTECA
jgi:hypothetical protein